jgi:broad specificity phosphatase PhoE
MNRYLVLVKHARPILDFTRSPSGWVLGEEGKAQARIYAKRLLRYFPFELATSPEGKAVETAEIIGRELGIEFRVVDGLQELHRPRMKRLETDELSALIREVFLNPTETVLGRESAEHALTRFTRGLQEVLTRVGDNNHLVVVSHGIVISLFVQAHNDLLGSLLWETLQSPALVVLTYPNFMMNEIVFMPDASRTQ